MQTSTQTPTYAKKVQFRISEEAFGDIIHNLVKIYSSKKMESSGLNIELLKKYINSQEEDKYLISSAVLKNLNNQSEIKISKKTKNKNVDNLKFELLIYTYLKINGASDKWIYKIFRKNHKEELHEVHFIEAVNSLFEI